MITIRTKLLPLISILLTVLLAGCGQGNSASTGPSSSQEQSSTQSAQQTIALAAAVTGATGIEIDNYTLVSSTRISRTVYEYIYKADVSNWGTGDATITATLASNAAHITVMEGALSFGDVIEGATEESTDTFTIRHDRSQPFDEDALVWTVQATPLPPTTFELIDQALADGVINAETALLYKVYHEFNDSRLPAQYVGRDDGTREATAIHTAIEDYATFSPATQALLTPFLLPPDHPDSWYQLGLNAAPASAAAPQSATAGAFHALTGIFVPATVVPGVEDVPGGLKRIRITKDNGTILVYWNDTRYPEDAATAFDIADAIDTTIWPKLTALLGIPPMQTGGALPIHLVNTSSLTAVYEEDATGVLGLAKDSCHPGIPIVYLSRDNKKDIVQTAAHEITHAIQARFPRSGGCKESRWLAEATATWAEHYTYPVVNTEHDYAPKFLNEPATSLDVTGDQHEYGAYLWFLYVTQGDATGTSNTKTQRVRATWDALASHNSLGAVNAAVSDIGGLDKQWPEFALYNWNRKQKRTITLTQPPSTRVSGEPYAYYGKWDGLLHKARESTTAVPASGEQLPKIVKLDGGITMTYGLSHLIRPLAAKYWHFDFRQDNSIRRVRVRHPYSDGTQPWAKVQVIVKLRDKEWMPAQDWTTFERKTLCRDKPDEDFEELVVVISNSEHTANNILSDIQAAETAVDVSALGCSNWTGSVQFGVSGSGPDSSITETGEATNVTWEIISDRFTAQEYQLTGGTVHWRHSGSDAGCTGESEGGYTLTASIAGVEAFAAFAGMYDKPAGATFAPGYVMWGRRYFGVTPPADYLCPDGSTVSPIRGRHDVWLDMSTRLISKDSPGLYDSDETGSSLMGSSVILEDDGDLVKRATYTWTFQKNGTYDGEPEL